MQTPFSSTLSVTGALSESELKPGRFSQRKLSTALQGTRTHLSLEKLKYQSNPIWPDWICSEPFVFLKEIVSKGFVEYGFLVRSDEGVLRGQIDLWGQDAQGQYWVVDYKTGSVQSREKAFRQMNAYAKALKTLGKIPKSSPVHLAAVYLNEGELFTEVAE